jgi:hypothetical protein
MFNKLCEKIESKITKSELEIKDTITRKINSINCDGDFVQKLYDKVRWVVEHDKAKEQYIATLQSQQRTIEQLIGALGDKYEHGLFIFSEDGKIPTVIRNGKEITNELTSSFSIDWSIGEIPNIHIEQLAATQHDSEV